MNFISYNDCAVSINGKYFYALSASLSSSAGLRANRIMGGEIDDYSPINPLSAKVSIEYYITDSVDPIAALTGNTSCNGNFGGVNFSGACLTSYSLSIAPYRPISIKSNFDVYSGFSQSLVGTSFPYEGTIDVANAAKTNLENFNSNNIGLDNPIAISYQVGCQRLPSYVIGSEYPKNVNLGTVIKEMSIAGENVGELISYSGNAFAEISVSPKTINSASRGETLTCKGVIREQNLSVSTDSMLEGSITIVEDVR